LQVDLSKIKMNRNWGYTSYRLGLFAITPDSIENTYSKNYKQDAIRKGRNDLISWDIDLKTKKVQFQDKNPGNHNMEFLAEPMLGCIGVAPEGNFNPTSGPSGEWGGNIDYNQIVEGSTVYLPVFQEGVYLYVGDGHALQGDGEPLGTGIETSMDLEFSVEVIKNKKINMPRLETSDFISSIGSQPEFSSDLNRGLQIATSEMITWLIEDYKMKPSAAHLLIGMVAKYEVITVAGSVGLKIMKKYLPK
jgi:acetamidase/formamidase